jgi:hypothetical protein
MRRSQGGVPFLEEVGLHRAQAVPRAIRGKDRLAYSFACGSRVASSTLRTRVMTLCVRAPLVVVSGLRAAAGNPGSHGVKIVRSSPRSFPVSRENKQQ